MSVSTKYKDQTIAQLTESGSVTLETAGKYCEDNITVEYAASESGGFSGSYNDLTDKPTIPEAVTEDTVSGWGFTKNTGTYSKPAAGIPKSDLDSGVQASLGKADSALQSHQSLAAYRTASAQDVIDATKQDKLIAGENITIDNGVISASGSSTGGGGVIEVALTPGTGHYVADKTYDEIYARYAAGTSVVKMSFIDSFGGEPEIQYAVITAASKYGLWLTENGERTWTAHSGLYQYTGTTWTYSATVDSALSDSSAKPVENRAVTAELKKKLEVLPMASSSTYGVVKPTTKTSEMTREVGVDKEGALWTASGSYNDLTDKPTIPDAVTEDTVSGWGFTKNTGTYSKPAAGIPKSDLDSAVQASLGKADAIPASPKYTDTVYDDTAVKNRLSAIEGLETVTLSVVSSRLTNVAYTARYSPLLGMVFMRLYGTVNADLATGYDYDIMNIGGSLPNAHAALAVKCNKQVQAFAKSNGVISLRPLESGIKSYDIYITGFWFVS